jgi:hypothetical protein
MGAVAEAVVGRDAVGTGLGRAEGEVAEGVGLGVLMGLALRVEDLDWDEGSGECICDRGGGLAVRLCECVKPGAV